MPNLNNSGIALPRFESADVTLFDAHAGSQLLLGKLRLNAIASNVFSNHPPDIHGRSHDQKILMLFQSGLLM